jgi:hypothetical protein
MTNRGATPVDPNTQVGQLRLLIGDIESVPLDPAEAGFADYNNFSDDELQGFLNTGGTVTRASGYAYLRLAAVAAAGAISWRSDDLSVDGKIMASEYRLLARIAFEQADAEDALGDAGFAVDFQYQADPPQPYGWNVELAQNPYSW